MAWDHISRIWTPKDDTDLKALYNDSSGRLTDEELGSLLNRSGSAISTRRSVLGLKRAPKRKELIEEAIARRQAQRDLESGIQGDRDHVAVLLAHGGFHPTWEESERRLMAMRLTRKIAA